MSSLGYYRAGSKPAIQIDGVPSRPSDDVRPYLRLWAAVIGQAAKDIRKRNGDRPIPSDVHAYLTDPRDVPGSFTWVCDVLGIAPDRARSALLNRPGPNGGRARG